ncbi:uncharacterized protein LOC119730296 [Patiria miniata]|uniref:THAP-type domain-containing protein n=1 Tax=Patiria miniata TaxID=46514 RepID=A0A914A5B1_PATMI|nr:uncharacterized protein LOC119730296 [Patiria miniata]
MRICASKICHHSSRHLKKWQIESCDEHGLPHGSCGCSPPFRFHYFPANLTVREEWVERVDRYETGGSGITPRRWQPRIDSVLCSEHFVNGAPSKEYPIPWLKLGRDFGTPIPARRVLKRKILPLKKTLESAKGQDKTPVAKLTKCVAGKDVQMDSVLSEHSYSYSCRCCEACTCRGCCDKDLKINQLSHRIHELESIITKKAKLIMVTKYVHCGQKTTINNRKDIATKISKSVAKTNTKDVHLRQKTPVNDTEEIVSKKSKLVAETSTKDEHFRQKTRSEPTSVSTKLLTSKTNTKDVHLRQKTPVNDTEEIVSKKLKLVAETSTKDEHFRQKTRSEPTSVSTKLLTSDKKVQFYTGLQSKAVFDSVFQYLEPKLTNVPFWRGPKAGNKVRKGGLNRSSVKYGPCRKLQSKDLFLMVLMKQHMGLRNADLADRFQVSTGHCSRIVSTWAKSLAPEFGTALEVLSEVKHCQSTESLSKARCVLSSFEES